MPSRAVVMVAVQVQPELVVSDAIPGRQRCAHCSEELNWQVIELPELGGKSRLVEQLVEHPSFPLLPVVQPEEVAEEGVASRQPAGDVLDPRRLIKLDSTGR